MCMSIPGAAAKPATITVMGRVVDVVLPHGYNERTTAYPVLLLLHGLAQNPNSTAAMFFGSTERAANSGPGQIVLLPRGTQNASLNEFWDSNDKCCRLGFGSPVNDTDFLIALLEAVFALFRVDRHYVIACGYSNGAMMAQTLGQCRPDLVTHVIAMSGFRPKPTDSHYCDPTLLRRCHFTGIWGVDDTTVRYLGVPDGMDDGADVPSGDYYGAVENAQVWSDANGCTGTLASAGTFDFTGTVGSESTLYLPTAQADDASVALVSIAGSDHNPSVNATFLWWLENRIRDARRNTL